MESIARLLLYTLVVWAPVPFGSTTEFALLPLVAAGFLLLAAAASARSRRAITAVPAGVHLGALAFFALALLQVIPLGSAIVGTLSPRAESVCRDAAAVHSAMTSGEAFLPCSLSVSGVVTARELLRYGALYALLLASAVLIRTRRQRIALAATLGLSVVAQVAYAMHTWAGESRYGTHDVLGWHNARIFGRLTGTFVNPNHFAAYLLLAIPFFLTFAFTARRRNRHDAPPIFTFVLPLLGVVICTAGILLSQSRAVLLLLPVVMLAAGVLVADLLASRRWRRRAWLLGAGAALLLFAGVAAILVWRLGGEARTLSRLRQLRDAQTESRIIGYRAAIDLWSAFPVFGTGLGTFGDMVLMVQPTDINAHFDHAHNDYLEIAATGGAIGFLAAITVVGSAIVSMIRRVRRLREKHPDAALYGAGAALAVLAVAAHSLVDFDLFIPAIPATLAILYGSACGVTAVEEEAER